MGIAIVVLLTVAIAIIFTMIGYNLGCEKMRAKYKARIEAAETNVELAKLQLQTYTHRRDWLLNSRNRDWDVEQ